MEKNDRNFRHFVPGVKHEGPLSSDLKFLFRFIFTSSHSPSGLWQPQDPSQERGRQRWRAICITSKQSRAPLFCAELTVVTVVFFFASDQVARPPLPTATLHSSLMTGMPPCPPAPPAAAPSLNLPPPGPPPGQLSPLQIGARLKLSCAGGMAGPTFPAMAPMTPMGPIGHMPGALGELKKGIWMKQWR